MRDSARYLIGVWGVPNKQSETQGGEAVIGISEKGYPNPLLANFVESIYLKRKGENQWLYMRSIGFLVLKNSVIVD